MVRDLEDRLGGDLKTVCLLASSSFNVVGSVGAVVDPSSARNPPRLFRAENQTMTQVHVQGGIVHRGTTRSN